MNAPHSKRFAQFEDARKTRQRLGLRWLQHRFPPRIDSPANPDARISVRRRTIHLLRGEKAGIRESVRQFFNVGAGRKWLAEIQGRRASSVVFENTVDNTLNEVPSWGH